MEKEIEFPLFGFTGGKCGRITDFSKNVISNRDACILLIHANGGEVHRSTLIRLLQAFRPLEGTSYYQNSGRSRELRFTYLFNSYYGHCCDNPDGKPVIPYFSGPRTKESLFWRVRKGYYRLTTPGIARLTTLLSAKCVK